MNCYFKLLSIEKIPIHVSKYIYKVLGITKEYTEYSCIKTSENIYGNSSVLIYTANGF